MKPEKKSIINSLNNVVKKYFILISILSALLALALGNVLVLDKTLTSNLVVFCAILTIYPSMIQLKMEGLLKSVKRLRQIALSIFYVFIVSPALAFLIAPHLGNPTIGVGYVMANVVPASSASLGYVLIAGGSIELATILAVLTLFIGIPVAPFLIRLYSGSVSIPVPIEPIITSLIEVLLLPRIVGQLTRYLIIKSKGLPYVEKTIKPHLSLATMLALAALIFVLMLNQARGVAKNPAIAILIIFYQSIVIAALLLVSLLIDKFFKISYEDHQALSLISMTKNQSVAAAMAVSTLGPQSALAPALLPMLQSIIAIAYLSLEGWIKRFLG